METTTTTTGMITSSLFSGRRENYLINDRILRVLHRVRSNSLYRGFFLNEINNTISIQIYLYPNPAAFQTRPNFKTVEAMTAKISDLTSYCKQADLFVFVLRSLYEFSALFCRQVYGQ